MTTAPFLLSQIWVYDDPKDTFALVKRVSKVSGNL